MTRNPRRMLAAITGPSMALLLATGIFLSAPAIGAQDQSPQVRADETGKLEAFVAAYTDVYFAVGACNGFITPQEEAGFDPFGPMLAQWPESFKQQMAETREEGKIASASLAKQNGFTRDERAELCRRQLQDATTSLRRVRARYGERS